MGLGFSPWGDPAMQKVARTHAQEMAEEYRRHLGELRDLRTSAMEAASAFDLLGDPAGQFAALAKAAEIDVSIERCEANLGEWT